MPSKAVVDSIGLVFKVVILGGNQITRFYSKKSNPIFPLRLKGIGNVPQGQP